MKKILTTLVLGSLFLGLVTPIFVSAQGAPMEGCTIHRAFEIEGGISGGGEEFLKGDVVNSSVTDNWGMVCVFNTIYTVTDYIFYILVTMMTIMIILGGFYYLTAAGNPEKASKGKSIIVYAIVGFVIALLAKMLPAIVKFFMGV